MGLQVDSKIRQLSSLPSSHISLESGIEPVYKKGQPQFWVRRSKYPTPSLPVDTAIKLDAAIKLEHNAWNSHFRIPKVTGTGEENQSLKYH